MSDSDRDVHTEHCCSTHGCKYGEDYQDCSVASLRKPQSFPCEACEEPGEDEQEEQKKLQARLDHEISRGIAVDAELERQRKRAEAVEAELAAVFDHDRVAVRMLNAAEADLANLRSFFDAMTDQRDALKELLNETIETLKRVGCQFSACQGPTLAPVPMRTCYVCTILAKLFELKGKA